MCAQLSSGEHVVLHLFLKAVRLNGSVLVRGAGWAESADRVQYHALHMEFLRQPGDIVRDALQRKFVYLRETGGSGREHEFSVQARTWHLSWTGCRCPVRPGQQQAWLSAEVTCRGARSVPAGAGTQM